MDLVAQTRIHLSNLTLPWYSFVRALGAICIPGWAADAINIITPFFL